jgi:hypothetical protein
LFIFLKNSCPLDIQSKANLDAAQRNFSDGIKVANQLTLTQDYHPGLSGWVRCDPLRSPNDKGKADVRGQLRERPGEAAQPTSAAAGLQMLPS